MKTMTEIYEYLKQINYNKSTINICYLCEHNYAIFGTQYKHPAKSLSSLEDDDLVFDIHPNKTLKDICYENIDDEIKHLKKNVYEDFRKYDMNSSELEKYFDVSEDPWIWIDKIEK